MIPVDVSVDGSARARWPMREMGDAELRRRGCAFRTRTHAGRRTSTSSWRPRPRPPSRRRRREAGVCGAGGRMGEMSREIGDARAAQQSVSMARAWRAETRETILGRDSHAPKSRCWHTGRAAARVGSC